jgi:hypothetical protein
MGGLYDQGHWNDDATNGNETNYVIEHQNFSMLNDNKLAFWKFLHANYGFSIILIVFIMNKTCSFLERLWKCIMFAKCFSFYRFTCWS